MPITLLVLIHVTIKRLEILYVKSVPRVLSNEIFTGTEKKDWRHRYCNQPVMSNMIHSPLFKFILSKGIPSQ